MPNYGKRKQSKCIFDADRRFKVVEFEISEFESNVSAMMLVMCIFMNFSATLMFCIMNYLVSRLCMFI